MKKKFHVNSLFFKIVCTALIGIVIISVMENIVNIMFSKSVFVNSFAESQEKIFDQIDSEFYDFYKDMTVILNDVSTSDAAEEYLHGSGSALEQMKQGYDLEQLVKSSRLDEYYQASFFLICKNQTSYLYRNTDRFTVEEQEILDSSVAAEAMADPGRIICRYQESGFSSVNSGEPVVIFAKAWAAEEGEPADMLAFIAIKEDEIRRMYSAFTVETSDIVILNEENDVLSSDNMAYFDPESDERKTLNRAVQEMTEQDLHRAEFATGMTHKTYLMQRLQNTNYKIMGTIDFDAAFWGEYRIWDVILMTFAIMIAIVFLIFIFIRQQTRPLDRLAETMMNSKHMNFKEHVPVEGTDEVRELSETYNQMVDELGKYVDRVISVEQDKRAAEIHALQMQINPHYMYNTLASIKWLIWQGDTQKSTAVIDAFISLLRNTISNTEEFITVEQEIDNLKNYVLINQARYGDAVQAEFFVLPQCLQYKVPKLILQPFVENAFFHGFPEGRRGTIQIFVKEEAENLRFEIIDDGVGMTAEQLRRLSAGERSKAEHFTGIGIGNVDERIKLIYGMDYGINIFSEKEKGTTILLLLRKNPKGVQAAAGTGEESAAAAGPARTHG